jgi:hypothetical protein
MKFAKSILPLALFLTSCDYYYSNFRVVNQTHADMQVILLDKGRQVMTETLSPGREIIIVRHFTGESGSNSAKLYWRSGQKTFSTDLCYYTDFHPPRGSIYLRASSAALDCDPCP